MKKIILLLTVISVIAFQSCKKDEFTNPDRTSRTSDTPISLIIDGTPVIEQTEQPSGGLEIHIKCVEPFDRTCYMLTIKDGEPIPSNGFININSPKTDEIIPSGTDIPIKNIKFHNESKSAVSFELVK